MASFTSLITVLLLLLCVCSDPLAARKVKRQGKARSVLRECEDNAAEGADCDFLREHSDLWKELSSMRQQIRKLKSVQEVPKEDNQITIAELRLQLLELNYVVNKNRDHVVALDKNINILEGEDERFRESLRHLKEVDNMDIVRKIEELHVEKEQLQKGMESLVETVEDGLQGQIERLNEIDQAFEDRIQVIETQNLTQIHTKIDGLIKENLDLKDHVKRRFQHHKKYVDGELDILQDNLNDTLDLVNSNDRAQNQVNTQLKDDIGTLYTNSFDLGAEINRVEQETRDQSNETNERINSVTVDLAQVNDTLYHMDQHNRLHHADLRHSLNVLENKTTDTDYNINELKRSIASQHEQIHNLLGNLTLSHEQMNSSFLDFQVAEDVRFRATNAEVDSLRFGKEYVNSTLIEILETHAFHYNQTVSDLRLLREENAQQYQNLTAFALTEYMERLTILQHVEALKQNDTVIYSEIQHIRVTEDRERNQTRGMIQILLDVDRDINSSLKDLHTRLAGPFLMFTSYPSTIRLIYATGDPLVFDKTILNQGGYYDADNGWFECPVHGVYQCFLSVWGDFDKRAQVELLVDRTVVMKAVAQPVAEARQHGSNQAVFECRRGQRVSLRGGTFGVLYTDDYRQNSFTGILIHNLEHTHHIESTSGGQ